VCVRVHARACECPAYEPASPCISCQHAFGVRVGCKGTHTVHIARNSCQAPGHRAFQLCFDLHDLRHGTHERPRDSRSRDVRNIRIAFSTMQEVHRIGRRVRQMEQTKHRQLEAAATDNWVDMYYDMDYKRKNLARLLRRYGNTLVIFSCSQARVPQLPPRCLTLLGGSVLCRVARADGRLRGMGSGARLSEGSLWPRPGAPLAVQQQGAGGALACRCHRLVPRVVVFCPAVALILILFKLKSKDPLEICERVNMTVMRGRPCRPACRRRRASVRSHEQVADCGL
jgi:hypothetical protein